jgi:RNA polymerase-binding transcription factor DksA
MDDQAVRQRLDAERARLEELRSGFADEHLDDESETQSLSELSSVDQHQADLGSETFEREKDLSILEKVEAELAGVEYALARLDDGSYGTCESCGQPINDDRLAAQPAARFCVHCQATAEREARVSGTS